MESMKDHHLAIPYIPTSINVDFGMMSGASFAVPSALLLLYLGTSLH